MRCLRVGIDEEEEWCWLNDFVFLRGLQIASLFWGGADDDKLVGQGAKDEVIPLEEAEASVPRPQGNFIFAIVAIVAPEAMNVSSSNVGYMQTKLSMKNSVLMVANLAE